MNDYISREAALQEVEDTAAVNFELDSDFYKETMAAIETIPAADVVEVVRCKQCKEWIPGIITPTDDFIPPRCTWLGKPMHADDYCSYGERKDGADNG